MDRLRRLYNSGEASFFANFGPLVKPIADRDEFESGTKRIPTVVVCAQRPDRQDAGHGDNRGRPLLGRIGDAVNAQAREGEEVFDAYSIAGKPKELEGAPGASRPANILTDVGASTFVPAASSIKANVREMNKNVGRFRFTARHSPRSVSLAIDRKDLLASTIRDAKLPSGNRGLSSPGWRRPIANQFKQGGVHRDETGTNYRRRRDVFYVQQGGFDGHEDHFHGTADLLAQVNAALGCFVDDAKYYQGIWDGVTILLASEFGRTLTSNGASTDHAWGENHFVAGGSNKGDTIHGTYPDDLTNGGLLNIGRGRLIHTTAWEGVWKGVAEWFGIKGGNMKSVLPNLKQFLDNIFGESNLYE